MATNLLPWREGKRRKQNRSLLGFAMAFWLVCLGAAFALYANAKAREEDQAARVEYLQQGIAKLDAEIKTISSLQEEKSTLLERIDIIQGLQHNRMLIVRIMDDLVCKLPPGVTLDGLGRSGETILLAGRAKSNERVAELMNQLDSSHWFGQSSLDIVKIADKDSHELRAFELKIIEKKPGDRLDAEPLAVGTSQ